MAETRDKVFEALHTGTISALGSLYKWIVASLLAINAGALITLTQQPTNHFMLLQVAGLWFSLGLIFIIIGAFGAIIAAIGGFMGVTADEMSSRISVTIGIGSFIAAAMPLVSTACFVIGGVKILAVVPTLDQACGSAKLI